MTISPRNAHTSLAASATLLASIATRVAQGVGNVQAAINDGQWPGVERSTAEDAGIRSIGDISDPTQRAALTRIAADEHFLADVGQYIDTIRASIVLLVDWCNDHAPVVVEHPRCHGGRTVDEWSRPDCTNLTAYTVRADGSISIRGDGLCDRCRQAKSRWERSRQEVA